jgi:hypothetical protein
MPVERVTALLDRPSPKTMGMVPIAIRAADSLRVSGLATERVVDLAPAELEALLREGNAIDVDVPLAPHVGPLAAAWVGRAWLSRAQELDAPIVPFDFTHAAGDEGLFMVASPAFIYAGLDVWVRSALVRALELRSVGIARLMATSLPDRDETRAALWLTADPDAADRELAWWARWARGAGEPISRPDLLARVERACRETFTSRSSATDWTGALEALPGDWARLAAAVRACERVRPLLLGDERTRSVADGIVHVARQSVLMQAPIYDHDGSEQAHGLLTNVVESDGALRLDSVAAHGPAQAIASMSLALRALIDGETRSVVLHTRAALESAARCFIHAAYPDRLHDLPRAFAEHAAGIGAAAVRADLDVLRTLGPASPGRIFELPLWLEGEPPAWPEHLARYAAQGVKP